MVSGEGAVFKHVDKRRGQKGSNQVRSGEDGGKGSLSMKLEDNSKVAYVYVVQCRSHWQRVPSEHMMCGWSD